jgi:alanine racemase
MHSDLTSSGVLVVDLDALARNYRRVRDIASPAECAAVVKANAYGLGVAAVARRLRAEGCRRFFVATADEGVELRGIVSDAIIHVLDGVFDDSLDSLLQFELTPVLNSLQQIECWRPTGRPALLHFDTGMSRLGMDAEQAELLLAEPHRLAGLQIEYLMTHLACADEPEHALNREQLQRFARFRTVLPDVPVSIGNSAGAFLGPEHRGDLIRSGIALYGGNPFIDRDLELAPVAELSGRILQLREVCDTVTVGYGATRSIAPPATLAVVGVGYADGYRRCLGNRAFAAVRGVRVPVVGRVSMDYLCVDISALPAGSIRCGDRVELIGRTVPLDEIAAAAGTISYEILTGLGNRLQRVYEGEVHHGD